MKGSLPPDPAARLGARVQERVRDAAAGVLHTAAEVEAPGRMRPSPPRMVMGMAMLPSELDERLTEQVHSEAESEKQSRESLVNHGRLLDAWCTL